MNLKIHNQTKKQSLIFQTQKQTKKNNPHSNKNILHKTTKTIIHPKYKNANNNITKNQDYRQNNKPTKYFNQHTLKIKLSVKQSHKTQH